MKLGVTANWAQANEKTNIEELQSFGDQLRELNTVSHNEATWEREGNMVVPKSLDVAQIARANFSRTLTFERISIEISEAPFQRTFSMYTLRATAAVPLLDKLLEQIERLRADIEQVYIDNCQTTTHCDGFPASC